MKLDFTPRLMQILIVMLQEETIYSIKGLAEKIHVSKRTVQRELEYIEKPLRKYGISFQSKAGMGVWLEGTKEAKQALLMQLTEKDCLDVANKRERRKRLTLELLKDKTPKKLYFYSELLGVSETTISTDLDAIEEWFQMFHLRIVRRPGYGICIEGQEKNFRQAVRVFIDENIDTQMIKEVYKTPFEKLREYRFGGILNDDLLKRAVTCILNLQDKRIMNLTENSYIGLVLHVTIAINRILKQEIMEQNESLVEFLQKEEEYELASIIIQALEEEFEINIPEIEIAYICLHIKASKQQQIKTEDSPKTLQKEQTELWELIHEMIACFDSNLAYALNQDEEFLTGLFTHLQPTIIRLTNEMMIKNPLLEQIKKDYPVVFKKCQAVSHIIAKKYHCRIPEEEVGFLAIHFGAALVRLENQKEQKRKVYLGIICASGIGISRLMSTKISRYFKDRVEVTTYGKYDITPYAIERNDFFVSSLNLELLDVPMVLVSPLLVETDIEEIEKQVHYYETIPKEKEEKNEFTRQLEQVNYMAVQIKSLIKHMVCLKVDNQIELDELLMAVSEQLSPYRDRQSMIEEDIKKREEIGSQVYEEYGFALFHAKTKGVIRPSFSVCVTKDLKKFQHPYFKNIQVVIVMLLPDQEYIKENTQLLGYLSSMLVEEAYFLETMKNGNKEEIKEVLSVSLKQFFNQYLDQV